MTGLFEAMERRRSTRTFADGPVDRSAIERILWAAQGRLGEARRTVPSAGGCHPLEVRLAAFAVRGLAGGLYRFDGGAPDGAGLAPQPGAGRPAAADFAGAALGDQQWIAAASAIVGLFGRSAALRSAFSAQPPAERWRRYLWIECGAAAQNAALAAAALDVGMTIVAGFDDAQVARLFGLAPGNGQQGAAEPAVPLSLLVLGRPA